VIVSLQTRLSDLITSIGTDIKQLRTWITGSSSGDLTGLTTTDKTSVVNAVNEVKALAAAATIPDADTTTKGKIEIATLAEVGTGTDSVRAVTPQGVKQETDAVRTYADGLLDANNAYQYKGVIDCSANPNYPAASAGWTYKVSVAGKIGGAAGTNVEVGDTLTCLVDGSAAGNQATVGANWIIVQTNIDGAVTGPAASTAGHIATFSGATGKVIQDSAVAISTDGTMAANSDAKVSTEKAVLTYLGANYYTQTQLGNPDTDLAALYATAKA
jgi:hypothetical protein